MCARGDTRLGVWSAPRKEARGPPKLWSLHGRLSGRCSRSLWPRPRARWGSQGGGTKGPRGDFPQGAAGSSEHTTVVATCPGHGELRHQGHRTPVCGLFRPQSSRAGAARPAVHRQGSPCGPQRPAELFQRALKRDADGRSRGNKGRPGLAATLPRAGKTPSSPGGAATHPAGSAGASQRASSPAAPALGRDTKKAGCLRGHCGACGHHQPQ